MSKKIDKTVRIKPILKWAGGKTQLLPDLLPKTPASFRTYIEPFFGGGALFFALQPENAVIADSNPEIINVYQQVADSVDEVISYLSQYQNTSEMFYEVRNQDWEKLSKSEAAARTIYLNRTCFNGLYRVNRKGQFNVPYGKYKNPTICDEAGLRAASSLLKRAQIVCGDYKDVLREYAKPGDYVFLDPPYLPVSEYADFKRYTKEQFYEEDHRELAQEIEHLRALGCHTLLTNSNHPLVHELYSNYPIEVLSTKRFISSKGSSRKGEDVIIAIPPIIKFDGVELDKNVALYPTTRFMGSKRKLLKEIWGVASRFEFTTVIDLFSGSGIVGYMFKAQGKQVLSNDYMAMSAVFAKAMIENNSVVLSDEEAEQLLHSPGEYDHFVSNTFAGLYFSDEDNDLIDVLRTNIWAMDDPFKQAIALASLIRACTKKRPRGIFTYTGHRYDDGRKDLKKSLRDHFLDAVNAVNKAVFDNGMKNQSKRGDAMELRTKQADLVYIDPPYYSPLSDNEYVRRYHFVEGLACDWEGVEIQENTQTKKFKSYPTPFSTKTGAADAFDRLFKKYKDSILIVSYSSNSLPTKDEMVALLAKHKNHVEVIPIDYTYSFGNQKDVKTNRNRVQEYLFVAFN